jgi:hypothetical protein
VTTDLTIKGVNIMRFNKLLGLVTSLLIIVMAALLVFVATAQDEEEVAPTLFIGTVTDIENEFVGIAVDGENVTIYICDGNAEEDTVSIAQWFIGTVTDGEIAITAANGNSVEAALSADGATGTFTFADGTTKEFVLALAAEEAALYRSEFSLGDDDYVGGWLVLPDGSVRGAISKTADRTLTPAKIMVIAV